MKQFISFPKIEQFRSVVKNVNENAGFKGLDDDGNPIYDYTAVKPTITFTGTVKLHGTNAAVCMNGTDYWAQSRKNIITVEKDNAGFAFFAESNKALLKDLLSQTYTIFGIDRSCTLAIYGEWCGSNIQKGVALNELDKMFVIFGIKVVTPEESEDNYFIDYSAAIEQGIETDGPIGQLNQNRIFFIQQFPTYTMQIDFNQPEAVQNKLIELTMAVEQECPVGKTFGVSGIGEGVVWHAFTERGCLRFKVKGEKHSSSKVKKLASVDPEKVENANKFAEYAVTESRLEQGIDEVFTSIGVEISKNNLKDFLNWIKSDIFKEETDTLQANGLEPKDVIGPISKRAVNWFLNKHG